MSPAWARAREEAWPANASNWSPGACVFAPSLDPTQALEAMLSLQPRSMPYRMDGFYHARYNLLNEIPGFFCMGLRLPDGTWLSILSGWRRKRVTYLDLQMKDLHFKKESLSAVMRAFMLEREITRSKNSSTSWEEPRCC